MQTNSFQKGEVAYILSGGQSRRFGQDKALVSIQGQLHLERLAGQLQRDGFKVVVVAQRDQDYSQFNMRQIFDQEPNAGPLAGLIAALTDCKQQGQACAWVVTCDMLEWRSEWLGIFADWVSAGGGVPSLDKPVVILDTIDFSPFPGRYCVSMLDFAVASWQAGNRSLRGLHQVLEGRVQRLSVASGLIPRGFNTAEDLAKLLSETAE